MALKTLTLERDVKEFNIFDLLKETEQSYLPVKYSGSGNLPAKRGSVAQLPVRIQDIELKSDRSIVIDGNRIEIPMGAKSHLTVGALKKLAGSYRGSLILERKGKSSVLLEDDDIIEIPKSGEKLELTVVPSFKTE